MCSTGGCVRRGGGRCNRHGGESALILQIYCRVEHGSAKLFGPLNFVAECRSAHKHKYAHRVGKRATGYNFWYKYKKNVAIPFVLEWKIILILGRCMKTLLVDAPHPHHNHYYYHDETLVAGIVLWIYSIGYRITNCCAFCPFYRPFLITLDGDPFSLLKNRECSETSKTSFFFHTFWPNLLGGVGRAFRNVEWVFLFFFWNRKRLSANKYFIILRNSVIIYLRFRR